MLEQGKLLTVERYSSYYKQTITTTFIADSTTPNDLYLIVTVTECPVFWKKVTYARNSADYSLQLYDSKFKILNKKYAPHGELTECNSNLAKRVFHILAQNYKEK